MSFIWSPQFKFSTWRRLWTILAAGEKQFGLPITDEQIDEMKKHCCDIDFKRAEEIEKEIKHDVFSHIRCFGEQAPLASPIIHLGATSCFVGDNTDLIQMKKSMILIKSRLVAVIESLSKFCLEYKDLPTLGFTHFQTAQMVTVGKRAALWLQDFVMDYDNLQEMIKNLLFRSIKGTTGTQASFLELFDGDHDKVVGLEKYIAQEAGFTNILPLSGQTYTRKIDYNVSSILSSIAQSASKFATDIRLLMHLKEIEEPFGEKQVGSSAMIFKRNPMLSERICGISRFVISLPINAAMTASTQWFERTLDDSANRRLILPQAFMGVDSILTSVNYIASGLVVYPKVIEKHLLVEMPYIATENILMASVIAGGNRQDLHEILRELSMSVTKRVKEEGAENNLLELIKGHTAFSAIKNELNGDEILNPKKYIGRCPEQVVYFVETFVKPILENEKKENFIV